MSLPTRTADKHCAILFQWLNLVLAKVAEDRAAGVDPDPNFVAIAEARTSIVTAIRKSAYLGRRLYGDEEHRTEPCPKHKGRWSGLRGDGCECEFTGWLPSDETRTA